MLRLRQLRSHLPTLHQLRLQSTRMKKYNLMCSLDHYSDSHLCNHRLPNNRQSNHLMSKLVTVLQLLFLAIHKLHFIILLILVALHQQLQSFLHKYLPVLAMLQSMLHRPTAIGIKFLQLLRLLTMHHMHFIRIFKLHPK